MLRAVPDADCERMTVTLLRDGAAHRRIRRVLCVVIGTVLAGILTVPAVAARADPSSAAAVQAPVTLTVAPLGGGVAAPAAPVTIGVTVHNPAAVPVAATVASVQLADAALTDRTALAAWLDGSAAIPGAGREIAQVPVDAVPAAQSRTATAVLAQSDPALAGRGPGVFPLWADAGPLRARSVLVIPGGATGSVGIIVPITAGTSGGALLSAGDLSELTAPDGMLTQQLDGVAGAPVTLAVDPAIVAAIRMLGEAAPATAAAWLDRLIRAPQPRFALQFGDADVATQWAAGLGAPLQPIPGPGPPPAAAPAPSGDGADTAPASLFGIGGPVVTAFWPPTGSTSPALAGALTAAAPGAVSFAASTATAGGSDGATVAAPAVADGSPVLVYDAGISEALADAADAENLERPPALAAATGQLAVALADAGGAPLVVTLDRPAEPTREGIRAAIAAIAAAPGVTVADVPTVMTAPGAPIALAEAAPDPARIAAAQELAAQERAVAEFATVLDDPTLLTGPQRGQTLQLLGCAWLARAPLWQDALAAHRTATSAVLDSVSILPTPTVNLLTAGTDLRFWVHNELPYPVQVVLTVAPDDLRLSVDRTTAVTASAASNTPVSVPVRARIATGEVKLAVSLHSPQGVAVGDTQTVQVSVRADWEGIGAVILGVLVAAFVVVGVIRTVRRRRRARVAADADDGADGDAGTGS